MAAVKRFIREDEKNIDFNDTRDTFIESWRNAVELHQLKPADQKLIAAVTTHQAFSEYIRSEQDEARKTHTWRRPSLDSLLQLHRHLTKFENLLQDLVEQTSDDAGFTQIEAIDTSTLWGLMYLNVKLSIHSKVKLKTNAKWWLELRRVIELLNNVVDNCRENKLSDDNNLRMQLMETFDPLMEVLRNSIDNLQSYYEDDDFKKGWSGFEIGMKDNISSISHTNEHLRQVVSTKQMEATALSKVAEQAGNMRLRDPAAPEERDIFPIEWLPHTRAEHFVGREQDMKRIHEVLGTENNTSLKTFTIYGRRGVGKTQIALEYARTRKSTYDAIFWVQCETRASLRQSFTTIAKLLELEGAGQNTFDENTMRVLRWLRHTEKRWLLIYDNAEREQAEQLHQYLPTKSKGSMLLTSRSYYNFFDDSQRQGETVQAFTPEERRTLLLKHLGDDWQAKHLAQEDMMSQMEEKAIEILLDKTRGLPIAIFLAAKMILDREIGHNQTARTFIEKFSYSLSNLPKRHLGERDNFVEALDAIWAIAFEGLTDNARTVLSILAFMSPDSILVDLFLPSDQSKLTGILQFCRSSAIGHVKQGPSIETVTKPSAALSYALEELVSKGLINRIGRSISLHRTVREGLAYANKEWFRDCFAAAVTLMYDAFPQQHGGKPLTDSWIWCRVWIPHAVQLAQQYYLLSRKKDDDEPPLDGMAAQDSLVRLLANCAWFLYEEADYDECLSLIEVAKFAATERTSTTFAHLLNTEGMIYYEQNKLALARQSMEECLTIRQELLEPDSLEMANIYNNLCNLETAEGNLDTALSFITRAAAIYEASGDQAGVLFALSKILLGRCYFFQRDYTAAYTQYQMAEGVLNKRVARNAYFTATLYYAYGNLHFAREEFELAAREYERCRLLMRESKPTHPLVAACWYKTACTEFERDHHKKALNLFNRAFDIADIKSNGKVNGTKLRIMWKRSEILEDYTLATGGEGARLAEDCAHQQRLVAEDLGIDLSEFMLGGDPEYSYDILVPGYFR